MTYIGLHDHFGRPDSAPLFALGTATLIVMITGSVWPPQARSVCPPVDTKKAQDDQLVDTLYEQIGRLQVELAWLKKNGELFIG